MSHPTRIAIHGAAGRMGLRLVALTLQDDRLALAAAIERSGHEQLARDAGFLAGAPVAGVLLTDAFDLSAADVLIDFATPAATRKAIDACVEAGVAMVIGTTGLTDEDHAAIDKAGESIAVLQAPNMSLGVNLLFALAGRAAKQLGPDYDIEIVEAHHRFKIDAPSGTALGIAQAICDATGKDINTDVQHGREGDAPRKPGEIGMHALRLGSTVGRHTVSFASLEEELQLTHIASTRDVFAKGALVAAAWLAGKPAGRYGMKDVLGL